MVSSSEARTQSPRTFLIERQPDGTCLLKVKGKSLEKLSGLLQGGEPKNFRGEYALEFTGHGVDQGNVAVRVDTLRLQFYEGLIYFVGGFHAEKEVQLPFTDAETAEQSDNANNKTLPETDALASNVDTVTEGQNRERALPSHVARPAGIFIDYDADRFAVPKGKMLPKEKLTPQRAKQIACEIHIRSVVGISVIENGGVGDILVNKFLNEVFRRGEMERSTKLPIEQLHVLNAYPQESILQGFFEEMVQKADGSENYMHRQLKALLQELQGSLLKRVLACITRKKLPAGRWAAEQLKILKQK